MKNFFKLISLITALSIFLFAFFGCTGEGSKGDEPNDTTAPSLETVRVTFPEGFTTMKIAEKLEENGVCKATDFLSAVNSYTGELLPEKTQDRPFLMEGYVFPDTYDFYLGESADSVLNRFLSNFSAKITENDKARAAQLGYSIDEILIIASIIQKEASLQSEMATVSSVLHNRLSSSTKLECNVTFEYVTDTIAAYLDSQANYVGGTVSETEPNTSADSDEISEAAIEDELEHYQSVYNTYKFVGLPAGPLCNPGYAAIKAALYPSDTDYFFFFTDREHAYHYSKTFEEHCALIDEFGLTGE